MSTLTLGSRSLLLASSLLLGPLALLAPPGGAYNVTCTASVDRITAAPMYADPGDTVRITVFLRDENPLPDPPGTSDARVRLRAEYADGTQVFGSEGVVIGPQDVAAAFVKSFVVRGDASKGLGLVVASLEPGDPSDPLNYCIINTNANTLDWGFWVTDKPDLRVQEGSVTMVRHAQGDQLPGSTVHDTLLSAEERFTRYPSVFGSNTCFEENANNVSRAHFQFKLENMGVADFKGRASGNSPMELQIRVKDGPLLVGTQTVEVQIATGAGNAVQVTLIDLNYSLVKTPGLRNIGIEVDSNKLYKETDENNTFLTPSEDPGRIYFRASDLVPVLEDVRLNADRRIEGTMSMRNHGDDRAGAPYPNTNICKSRIGGDVSLRIFLDEIDPANEFKVVNDSLDPVGTGNNETGLFDFTSPQVGPGQHKVILVADYVNATLGLLGAADELNETNNIAEAFLMVPRIPDDTPPMVTIVAPSPGAVYVGDLRVPATPGLLLATATVTVQAEASDVGSGVARVEFLVDGARRGVDREAPYTFAWDAGGEALGEHRITAVAVDFADHAAADHAVVVTVPTSPSGVVATLDQCRTSLPGWTCTVLESLGLDARALCRHIFAPQLCTQLPEGL